MDFIPIHIQQYAEIHSDPESPVLSALADETRKNIPIPQMLSGRLQGRILAMISKLIRPRQILEIGTYTGYSAICLAEGLTDDGKLITIDIDDSLSGLVDRYLKQAGIRDKVETIIGKGMDVLQSRKFSPDLVFIDADKENYLNYYKLVLPVLSKGGVILADNVLWSGRVTDPGVNDPETSGLRDFAKFVVADTSVEKLLFPVRDGIMLLRKK